MQTSSGPTRSKAKMALYLEQMPIIFIAPTIQALHETF